MPIHDGNSVTVGHICYNCGRYQVKQCPYNNHLEISSLNFKGDIANKCAYYVSLDDENIIISENNNLKKTASKMTTSELNVALYRRISAMEDKERKKVSTYWEKLFPKEYAKDMVTDENESKVKKTKEHSKRKDQFDGCFKSKKGDKNE